MRNKLAITITVNTANLLPPPRSQIMWKKTSNWSPGDTPSTIQRSVLHPTTGQGTSSGDGTGAVHLRRSTGDNERGGGTASNGGHG